MTSLSRETRQNQLVESEAKLQKRQTLLGAKGFDAIKIAHDIGVRQLKSKIKESQVRLQAIGAAEKLALELAARKVERLTKPKEQAPKVKREAKPPVPAETKPTEKKKK